MKKFFKIAIILASNAVFAVPALAQTGKLQPGQIWGNPQTTEQQPTGTTIGAILDRQLSCTARGSIIERGASAWACLGPSATVGLPLLSSGAGADLTYSRLGLAGIVAGTTDTVLGYFTGTTATAAALSNCSTGLTYSTSTHTFGCVGAGTIPLTALATQAADTVVAALSAGSPTAVSVPNCVGVAQALHWLTGTGFQCGSITAPAADVTIGTTNVLSGVPNGLLFNSASKFGNLATLNNGVLVTSGTGVPSISSTLPTAVQALIAGTGTLVSGATGAGFTVALGSSTITGQLAIANNCPGSTGASNTTFLRGDCVWATPTGSGNVSGPGSSVTGNIATYTNTSGTVLSDSGASLPTVDNFLPNVQWQLWSYQGFITKQNQAGTASQTAASCSGFSTSSLTPQFTCSNTQAIAVGDIVAVASPSNFWGYAGVGFATCAQVNCISGIATGARVITVVPNTSITLQGNFNGVSPASSSAATLSPITAGSAGAPIAGTAPLGADGWVRTQTLLSAPDDFTANSYPGAIRTLLLRKGAVTAETYSWSAPANQIRRFRGKTITCGVVVNQRVQSGAGTWRWYITDSSGTTFSSSGTGTAAGGYEYRYVTRTVNNTATSLDIGISTDGTTSDVYNVALPTCTLGNSIAQSQLNSKANEIIRPTSHLNPPMLTPLLINFPSVELVTGSGLYGWNNIDLEAISLGGIHASLGAIYAKIEWTTPTAGAIVFTGANVNITNGLIFGPQTNTAVANILASTPPGRWPIYHDGTVSIFTNISGLVMYAGSPVGNGTFDFTDADTTMPISRQ